MSTLPVTTVCYRERIAALQQQLAQLLDPVRLHRCTPAQLLSLEHEVRPLYAAIAAMHSEVMFRR